MTDFLGEKRAEITSRMKELQPIVDEYNRLEAAAQLLAEVPGALASPNGRRLGAGRPRGSKNTKAPAAKATAKPAARKRAAAKPATAKPAGKRRPGRRKGTGRRGTEALQIVADNPGIKIPEIAKKMGIKQSYLYRVLPDLEEAGLVEKDGRGWRAAKVAA